jgi:hydrogenase expression/formation protein HypC
MCLALPGKIVTIREEEKLGLRRGKIDFCGVSKEIRLDYTPEAQVGDYVLIHVGFAVTVVDAQEAQRIVGTLLQFAQLDT